MYDLSIDGAFDCGILDVQLIPPGGWQVRFRCGCELVMVGEGADEGTFGWSSGCYVHILNGLLQPRLKMSRLEGWRRGG